MGTWVLLVAFIGAHYEEYDFGWATAPSGFSQEFSSKERCLEGAQFFVEKFHKDSEFSVTAACVQK